MCPGNCFLSDFDCIVMETAVATLAFSKLIYENLEGELDVLKLTETKDTKM